MIYFLMISLQASANSLLLVGDQKISTEYFDLIGSQYKLPEALWGVGGAIKIMDKNLIFASANGNFLKINTDKLTYQEDFLPKINTGSDDIKKSKRITYQELLPRVHDVGFFYGSWYVSYDKYSLADDCIYFVISKFNPNNKTWATLYTSPKLDVSYYAMGTGGKLAAKDNKLFFTVGDYSLDRINKLPSDVAPQNIKLPWGKVNYIDLKSNEFNVYTLGHRNALGLVMLKGGAMVVSENGPKGGDELNVIKKGMNYGWPYKSYGTGYGSFRKYSELLPVIKPGVYEDPMYAFVPSVAPSQLIQVIGFDPEWDGDILLGSLKAMTLFHIKISGERVVYSEPIYIGHRIRDLQQDNDKFFLLTDDNSILQITKVKASKKQ